MAGHRTETEPTAEGIRHFIDTGHHGWGSCRRLLEKVLENMTANEGTDYEQSRGVVPGKPVSEDEIRAAQSPEDIANALSAMIRAAQSRVAAPNLHNMLNSPEDIANALSAMMREYGWQVDDVQTDPEYWILGARRHAVRLSITINNTP